MVGNCETIHKGRSQSHNTVRPRLVRLNNINGEESVVVESFPCASHCERVRIALLADVRQDDRRREFFRSAENLDDKRGTLLVRKVANAPDALLQPDRTGRFFQHLRVVV